MEKMKETYKEILNDIEKGKIEAFLSDDIMVEAVRKVLLSGIYEQGVIKAGLEHDPKKNFLLAIANAPSLTNETIGQEVRSAYWGITILDAGFANLENYKKSLNPNEEKVNKAL